MKRERRSSRLRTACAIAGIDYRILSKQLGISRTYLSKMNQGKNKITQQVNDWIEKTIKEFVSQEEININLDEIAIAYKEGLEAGRK